MIEEKMNNCALHKAERLRQHAPKSDRRSCDERLEHKATVLSRFLKSESLNMYRQSVFLFRDATSKAIMLAT